MRVTVGRDEAAEDAGAFPAMEEAEDSGFVYYSRFYGGETMPVAYGPLLSPLGTFSDALNLIASGALDDKVRWISERDPDWFVANVLAKTLGIPDSAERGIRLDERMLDQAIAAIALRDNVRLSRESRDADRTPLRHAG